MRDHQCNLMFAAAVGLPVGLCGAASPAFHAEIEAAAPSLWYRFDEPDGVVQNHGSLGAAFDGTVFGGVERGFLGAGGDDAFRFRQGGWIESLGSSPLTGNPTFSVEAVVRLDPGGAARNWGPFLHWGSGGTGREVYFGVQNRRNNTLYAGFYNAGVRSADVFDSGEWLHVVWTRVGGGDSEAGSALYVDGTLVAIETDTDLPFGPLAAGAVNVSSTPFRINQGQDFFNGRFFTGELDELAVYDRVLDPAEIEARAALVPGSVGCSPADLDTPLGVLDIFDILTFFKFFGAGHPLADLASPSGVLDLFDILAFFELYTDGC